MEETKCLKPSDSGSRIGDRASVKAATRVNAEQASHGVVQVKSVCQGDVGKSPVFAPVSEVRAQLHDAARFRARSTSHSVAVHDGCTNIPLAAGKATEDQNHSRKRAVTTRGFSRCAPGPPPNAHGLAQERAVLVRFVSMT